MNVHRFACAIVSGTVAALMPTAQGADVLIQKVAVIGDPSPLGAFSYAFGTPRLNTNGILAFDAATRIGLHDYPSVWSGSPGALVPRVVTGETVMTPQGPVVLAPNPMQQVRINSNGDLALMTNGMVIRDQGGVKQLLLRSGDAAFGGGTYLIDVNDGPVNDNAFSFNNQGRVAARFQGTSGAPFKTGLLLNAPGVRQAPFLTGTSVGPVASGLAVQSANQPLFQNNLGTTLTTVELQGTGVTASNDEAFVAFTGSQHVIVAREGSAVGGDSDGRTLRQLATRMSLTDNGRIGTTAALNPLVPGGAGPRCLLIGNQSGLEVRVREGTPAPGFSSGVTYRAFGIPAINDAGMAAFVADTTDRSSLWGVWTVGATGTPNLVTSYGQPAPGTQELFQGAITDSRVTLNAAGQILFEARLTGDGYGLFATTLAGNLVKVMATGDMIDVGSGVLRRVNTVRAANPGDALGLLDGGAFNDAGMVAIRVTFDDSTSGIYVAQVPTPGVVSLAAPLGLLAFRRRQRRILRA